MTQMKIALLIAALIAASLQPICAAAPAAAEYTALTKAVDQLCAWAGMSQAGAPRKIERSTDKRPSDVTYSAEVKLTADGTTRTYTISFDSKLHVIHFMPKGFDLGDIGLGYDTLKDSRLRQMCIRAVAKFNRALGWKSAVGPYVQRVGANFIVTFETVTAEEQKRENYAFLDPYISFLVTPKGTVFGGFRGA